MKKRYTAADEKRAADILRMNGCECLSKPEETFLASYLLDTLPNLPSRALKTDSGGKKIRLLEEVYLLALLDHQFVSSAFPAKARASNNNLLTILRRELQEEYSQCPLLFVSQKQTALDLVRNLRNDLFAHPLMVARFGKEKIM